MYVLSVEEEKEKKTGNDPSRVVFGMEREQHFFGGDNSNSAIIIIITRLQRKTRS